MYELRDCSTVCRLRSLKRFDARRSTDRVWRLYQEYCPNGTIKDMVRIYRRYNEEHPDEHLRIPEAYIWYVWHGLALALQAMNQSGRCQQMVVQPPDKKNWILHLDIKDGNVLLGPTPGYGLLEEWPVVKVCDWGLAKVTSKYDPRNSASFKGDGTECWFPPEQWKKRGYTKHWRDDIHGKNKPYTSAHGCWQFAALIYGMVALDKHNSTIDDALAEGEDDEDSWRKQGYKMFLDPKLNEQYSRKLTNLLEDCLSIKPEDRPSPDTLVRKTMEGCRKSAERLAREGDLAPYVFYGRDGYRDMKRWARARREAERRG